MTLVVEHCTECSRHPPTDDGIEYERAGSYACPFCGYGTICVRPCIHTRTVRHCGGNVCLDCGHKYGGEP